MTRPSKRELEQALSDLDAGDGEPETVDEAVVQALEAGDVAVEFRYRFDGATGPTDEDVPEDYVAAAVGETFRWYLSPDRLPDGVDPADHTLPVDLARETSVQFAEVDT